MSGIAFVSHERAGGQDRRLANRDFLAWLPWTAGKVVLACALVPPLGAALLRQLAARLKGDEAALLYPALLAAAHGAGLDVWADERGRLLLLAGGGLLLLAWSRSLATLGSARPSDSARSSPSGSRKPAPSGGVPPSRRPTDSSPQRGDAPNGTRDAGTPQRRRFRLPAGWSPWGRTWHPAGDRAEVVAAAHDPPPRDWLCAALVPYGPSRRRHPVWRWQREPARGYVTMVCAPRGVGKSMLLVDLALACLCGGAWLGQRCRRVSRVLYLDVEMDSEECRRRAARLARGRGLWAIPGGLRYRFLADSLATPEGMAAVFAAVRRERPDVVLLDSLTLGSIGAALSDPSAWRRILTSLERLGVPVVLIDHTGKDASRGAVGTFAKDATIRSLLLLERQTPGVLGAIHDKASFGPKLAPFAVRDEYLPSGVPEPACCAFVVDGGAAPAPTAACAAPPGVPVPVPVLPVVAACAECGKIGGGPRRRGLCDACRKRRERAERRSGERAIQAA